MSRPLAALFLASFLATTAAHAQVCSESNRCFNTIGSPGRYASIGSHRMLFANGELVWPSFVGVYALDLLTGRTRTLPQCGTTVSDIALEGSTLYMLADHAMLCRVSLATGTQHVQMLVASPNAVIQGFAVSALVVAYSLRRIGDQPEVRVVAWSNGQSRTYPTALTAEHIVVDATNVYWIDAGYPIRTSIATGAKTVGPRITSNVARMQVDHGIVYVATDHEVMRLDSAATSWTTVARESADDLVVDGNDVYWASASRGTITKVTTTRGAATRTRLVTTNKPYALALDTVSVFVAEDDPFGIKQVVPR